MRFKKRIDLNELKSYYQPDTTISFNLPKGKLDLHSLSLFYSGNPAIYSHITDNTAVIKVFNPLGTAVQLNNSRIRVANHGFVTGDMVRYETNGGDPVGGLTDNTIYYIVQIPVTIGTTGFSLNLFSLATTLANALAGTIIPLTSLGSGIAHMFIKDNQDAFRTIKRFFPRLSSSIISEMTIKINNEVKQHIQEYSMLNAILNDIYKEYDDIDGNSFDTVQEHSLNSTTGNIDNFCKITAVKRVAIYTDKYSNDNKRQFFIDKFLGFLNEGNRYIDTIDKDIQIIIKLSPASILYRGVNLNNEPYIINNEYAPDYILSDIYCTIDVLDNIPMQTNEFYFNDYKFVQGTYLNGNKKSLTSFQTDMPVEWVLGTFSNPNRYVDSGLQLSHTNEDIAKFGDMIKDTVDLVDINNKVPNNLLYSYEVAKFQKDPYLLNSSIYYDRQGKGIRSCKYMFNTYDLTPRLDIVACYNDTKKCFGTPYKKVVSLASFEENFFTNAVRLDDVSTDFKKIDWEVDIDPSKFNIGGIPMLFYCFKNKI